MATLISAIDFRERFDISTEIQDTRITPNIGSASRRLRKWVGEEAYADALLATPTDEDRAEDLKNAEAHLAYHFALLGMHFRMTTKGIVATAVASEGKAVHRYLSPAEAAELSTMMLETAREIVEPYAVIDSVPGSSYEVVTNGDD